MTFEEFQIGALDLGYQTYFQNDNVQRFEIDGVGVTYNGTRYTPYGWALMRYWTDELICDHLRHAVEVQGTAEMALDYLEMLKNLERITVDTYTD